MKEKPKRKAPDFSGVPGELVALDGLTLHFGKRKVSPYDPLLDQLSLATDAALNANKPAPGLRFTSVQAKASVSARAKLKGLRVSFAETPEGPMYVRIEGRLDVLEKRGDAIRAMLASGPLSTMVITSRLRSNGDDTVDAQGVEAMLSGMMKRGTVIRQEGNTWKLIIAKRSPPA